MNLISLKKQTKLKNDIISNIPSYNTCFTPFFYWDKLFTNMELKSILRRTQTDHNEYFRNLRINEISIR